MVETSSIRQWDELPDAERTRLLDAFGRYQDQLPPTCSLETKVARFQNWLQQLGIEYRHGP